MGPMMSQQQITCRYSYHTINLITIKIIIDPFRISIIRHKNISDKI